MRAHGNRDGEPTRITQSIDTPIRAPFTGKNAWQETWQAEDRGLIICWERGREQSFDLPELAAKARAGELPVTTWKGGIGRAIKKRVKYGCLEYLAAHAPTEVVPHD